MRVATNVQSIAAQRSLNKIRNAEEKVSTQLASGSRVTRAAYDPSGLAISVKMSARIRSMSQARRNLNDGISMVQVADGTLTVMSDISQRLRELAIQASSDTISDEGRRLTNKEFQSLKTEMTRMTKSTRLNGNKLLSDDGGLFDLQVGIDNDKDLDRFTYNMNKILTTVNKLGIDDSTVSGKEAARKVLDHISNVIQRISESRATLGAMGNRMESAINNNDITSENMSSSNSKIKDVDIAVATAERTKEQIKKDATVRMLHHVNHTPEGILRLVS